MPNKGILSYKFNMSLGFIPVITSIILCEFIAQDISIYTGAAIGGLYSIYTLCNKRARIPNYLLYGTTIMLLLLSIATLLADSTRTSDMLPLTLEIIVLIPTAAILLNRKRFLAHQTALSKRCCKMHLSQGAESTVVSTRVIAIIALLHFAAILIAVLLPGSMSADTRTALFHICPPVVFISSILFNQFGIAYFNKIMNQASFVPIVNTNGDVVGKALAADAINRKNDYINPVVRIAVLHDGMLYLSPRPQRCNLEHGKTDLPMECYLLYGETLEQSIIRLLKHSIPHAPMQDLKFNITYHFENDVTNRLIYLFIIEIDDDKLLCNKRIKGGKLWTLQQIESNLGKNFFSCCFENEYEHLKEIICTKEKYKEF